MDFVKELKRAEIGDRVIIAEEITPKYSRVARYEIIVKDRDQVLINSCDVTKCARTTWARKFAELVRNEEDREKNRLALELYNAGCNSSKCEAIAYALGEDIDNAELVAQWLYWAGVSFVELGGNSEDLTPEVIEGARALALYWAR